MNVTKTMLTYDVGIKLVASYLKKKGNKL